LRPFDQHIDSRELSALVPSPCESGYDSVELSPDAVREAAIHVRLCEDCCDKLSNYRRLINLSSEDNPNGASAGVDCSSDVDWDEVAAGRWPELRVKQLILHAALCDHCGPLLQRAASALQVSRKKEQLLADLELGPHRASTSLNLRRSSSLWSFTKWLAPLTALIVIVGGTIATQWLSARPLSGSKFAELAASIHDKQTHGDRALDVYSTSQQALNAWFKAKLQFPLELPASPAAPGEERPYYLEGARLVQLGDKTAAYIAYQMHDGPASLMVTPDSVAVASGGDEVRFTKVSFHYTWVNNYKVVTWSQHGLTYALVSHEGNRTQGSCMVCHSAMRDRDLTHTPTPLLDTDSRLIKPILQ